MPFVPARVNQTLLCAEMIKTAVYTFIFLRVVRASCHEHGNKVIQGCLAAVGNWASPQRAGSDFLRTIVFDTHLIRSWMKATE